MGALPEGGAMAAIEATEQEVTDSIKGKAKELAIAAVNGPTSTVISGTEEAVEEIQAQWDEKGRKTKRLSVSHAFHSPLMEPMLEQFAEVANSLTYSEPKIPLVSNLTGEPLSKEQATDPAYWVSHAREPVRFADAIATLKAQGTTTYLELGPDPVLCAMARECLGEEQDRAAFIPTLREGRTEAEAITTAIATAHVSGAKLDWGAFFKGTGAKRVPLPTYPFQRERYWFGGEESATAALHKVSWQEIAKPTTEATEQEVLEIAPVKGDVPEAAQKAAEQALAQLQAWIAEEANEGSRLTLLTHNAIATKEGEAPDLTTAAVWGLVRSAISEHPGRFAVIDTDRSEASTEALPAALALGAQEPQIALRDGEALAPRLAKLRAGDQEPTTEPLDPQSTVLITGGLSGLGALVARHLTTTNQAKHLLLLSRRGIKATGAKELKAELKELGAEVRVAACDVTDKAALKKLIAQIPKEHPLGAVIHSAGAIDDGVLGLDGPRAPQGHDGPQGERRLAPARADKAGRALPVRPLLLSRRPTGRRRPGQLRRRQRLP